MNMYWLTRFTSTCQFTSEEIVLSDEDLLTLILLHVPYRKLKSLKCVSKTWLYVITTPQFTRSLCNLLPHLRASGLFIQPPASPLSNPPYPDEVYFVPLDDPKTPSPYKTLTFAHDPFDPQRVRILGSCNGLLLCCTCLLAAAAFGHRSTYVYNPFTNQLNTLPQYSPLTPINLHLNLAFDPSKSPHFKVLAFVTTSRPDYIGDFHIYSSQTGTWSLSIQSFYWGRNIRLNGGVYWHGCIHWLLSYLNSSTAYDGLYFNVDEGTLGRFPGPPIETKLGSRKSSYFGESEHHLHFIEVGPSVTSLNVYEMKSDYSEWFIKYRIDLAAISKVFPEMTQSKALFYRGIGNRYAVDVLSLIRRENFQEDSFLVLEIPGKAIRYNLVDRSLNVIWNFAVDFGLKDIRRWRSKRYRGFRVWQYIEPLSCV